MIGMMDGRFIFRKQASVQEVELDERLMPIALYCPHPSISGCRNPKKVQRCSKPKQIYIYIITQQEFCFFAVSEIYVRCKFVVKVNLKQTPRSHGEGKVVIEEGLSERTAAYCKMLYSEHLIRHSWPPNHQSSLLSATHFQ